MARNRIIRQIFLDAFRSVASAKHRPNPKSWSDQEITGCCLGHSTVLLNFLGSWLLTDPVFQSRVGPGVGPFIIGPKRHLRPALPIREVPKPDIILLSHAHFDHLSMSSLRYFSRETLVVTASATKDLLRRFSDVRELRWNETITLPTSAGPVMITAIEVKHWGARMLRDDYRGYNGYLVEKEGKTGTKRICYTGDTAMTDSFAHLGKADKSIDLMLMPIGAYDPWIRAHCSPEQAYAMARVAGARNFVPVHHQTFKLSAEPMEEPGQRIRQAFAAHPENLLAVDVGETFQVPP